MTWVIMVFINHDTDTAKQPELLFGMLYRLDRMERDAAHARPPLHDAIPTRPGGKLMPYEYDNTCERATRRIDQL